MSQDPDIIVPPHVPPVALAELDAEQQGKVEKIAGHVRGILSTLAQRKEGGFPLTRRRSGEGEALV